MNFHCYCGRVATWIWIDLDYKDYACKEHKLPLSVRMTK